MPGLHPIKAHALRQQLNDEVHSRPSADVHAPMMVTQIAVITGETDAATERELLRELAVSMGAPVPDNFGNHLTIDLGENGGSIRLVWERHTEFSTYAFSRPCPDDPAERSLAVPFENPPLTAIPQEWRAKLPGEVLVGINLLALPGNADVIEARLTEVFGDNKCMGAGMSGGGAAAWTDFRLHTDGLSRIIVANEDLRPSRLGRLTQRLLDVETYRMMALLCFPMARNITPELAGIETKLAELAAETPRIKDLQDEQTLLAQLSWLAARVEDLAARTEYRFSAARAYHQLVERRITELEEVKRQGFQRIGTFMDRRLGPAMRTCAAVADRLDGLASRIARASNLLDTRVELALQEQNQALLKSMERRAHLQAKLQETIKGLSAAAITYYLVSLMSYGLKALEKADQPVNATLITGVLVPFVFVGVYMAIREIHKRVTRSDGGGD